MARDLVLRCSSSQSFNEKRGEDNPPTLSPEERCRGTYHFYKYYF